MKIKTASLLLMLTMLLLGCSIVSLTVYNLSNSKEIESTWANFEEVHSEKGRAINALRSEIGYGGMIHSFKNYVLRRDLSSFESVKYRLGGAKSVIARYRSLELNEKEKQSLDDIEDNLQSYADALLVAESMNNKFAVEVDRLVKVDDTLALLGMSVLLTESETGDNFVRQGTVKKSKSQTISMLRHAMGFGGMIHNFKNAILRADINALSLAKKDLHNGLQLTEEYLTFQLTDVERSAIRNIQNVLSIYSSRIEKISTFDLRSVSPEYIDRFARVDDEPALDGLRLLDKEIVAQSERAEEKITNLLDVINKADLFILYITVLTTLIFIVWSYWLLRLQIIKPVTRLTGSMTKIARNDLDIEIYGVNKTDEIGEMARAVEVFKKNVYLLESAKKDLQSVNYNLESRVLARTRELKNSEESLRSILETAVDAIITIDNAGVIRSFNRAAENMFGYNSANITGKNVNVLMPSLIKEKHNEYISAYIEPGEAELIGVAREMEACRQSGEKFPIHVSISEVNTSDGIFFTAIIRDVSELKTYQKSLQKSKDIADEANKAKSEFVANMSHELRTPLNAILGFAQLLECDPDEPLSSSQKESVDEIRTAGKHLIGIISQILELNKIEAGKLPVLMEQVSPVLLVQESLSLIEQMCEECNIELVDNADYDGFPDLFTDKVRFKQVLINLLSNAVKYNELGGQVILSTELFDKSLRFYVADTGKGIPSCVQSQIFSPFERLGQENGDIEGTGIGLSITKKIVELLKGEIGFTSEEGKGSCFWFELPLFDSLE
ncbi:MAG: PAS domain S-box protein [Gammaproteobacteria bacterium]|nr:PAS domain S-box protein [Gammaproteobacteria bacterium]